MLTADQKFWYQQDVWKTAYIGHKIAIEIDYYGGVHYSIRAPPFVDAKQGTHPFYNEPLPFYSNKGPVVC